MQQEFLNTFLITYSLQPFGDEASVFRRYPGQWMVFVEDPQLPGRYQLAKEMVARPVGTPSLPHHPAIWWPALLVGPPSPPSCHLLDLPA